MKLSIIGSGLMGSSIAVEFAKNGYDTNLIMYHNKDKNQLKNKIQKSIAKYEDEQKDLIVINLNITDDLGIISSSDVVIECIIEDISAKKELVELVKKFIQPKTIFASNTSSLLITDIFENYKYKNKCIGFHFFNPVKHMKLIEIAVTEKTSEDVFDTIMKLSTDIGKVPIKVKASKGYIVNRLLIPMINEASKIVDEGVATIQDIDEAMKLGANHPIGPLALSDLIGNDITYAILKELLCSEDEISINLLEKCKKGEVGRKSKKGYYNYK